MKVRLSFLLVATAVASVLAVQHACSPTSPPSPAQPSNPGSTTPTQTAGLPWFEDVTGPAGIRFQHFDSTTEKNTILETMGSGIAWIDYDQDGWLDLFCVQDNALPSSAPDPTKTHKLYRNNGNGTFSDVTEQVGLNKYGYGQGCAVGDFNNDGFDDLVVTYFGSISLFENRPDGKGGRRFEDVTAPAHLKNPHWGTSCGWADLDGDGFLDLYVCNYVVVDLPNYVPCENTNLRKYYICPPTLFPKVAHKLFRNNGDGTFLDVSDSSGLSAAPPGGGLAVMLIDLDGDGRVDIYVANDLGPAYVLKNEGGFKFSEKGLLSGAGLDRNGRFIAGMGIAAGNIDGSGRPSLFVSNYQDEPTMVFLNRGKMAFKEWSHPSGIGPPTTKTLGFGIDLFDADLDGNLDLVQANGHVYRNAMEISGFPQTQNAQLFLGDGKARFRDVTDTSGPYFREKLIGRGLASADFNNDGLPDLAISHNSGPVRLLRNATLTENKSLRLELVGDGKKSNRNAIGAQVEIDSGGRKQVRWIHGGGSYLSASDRRLLIGLGSAGKADRVTVKWPSGEQQEYRDLAAGRGWRLIQGKEAAVEMSAPPPH